MKDRLEAYDAKLQTDESKAIKPGSIEFLRLHGYAVLSGAATDSEIATLRAQFTEYHRTWPEQAEDYVQDMSEDVGAGGFGAVNLPSACHFDGTVHAQMLAIKATEPFLIDYAKLYKGKQVQYMFDRPLIRSKKQPPEAIHTDNSAGADKGDIVFAIMLPLTPNQCVSLVPGSHSFEPRMTGGDYTPSSPEDKAMLKERLITVPMPTGSILIMQEAIAHGIYSKKRKRGEAAPVIYRQFLGAAVSNVHKVWLPENQLRLKRQELMAHKGKDETPPLYPKLYWTNHWKELKKYAMRLRPEMLTQRTFKTGKNKGMTIAVPKSSPPVLKRYKRTDAENNRFLPLWAEHGFKRQPPAKPNVVTID